jgi:4-alpha-glucanotransferase
MSGPASLPRRSGILLPLFSMPSSRSWGIGEFADIPVFARWMREAGMSLLQFLPINEMAPGQSSPYSAISAMALDPIFIAVADVPDYQAMGGDASLDTAVRGVIDELRVRPRVDYAAVRAIKERTLRRAFAHFVEREWAHQTPRAAAFRDFIEREGWWLDDYAVFRAAFHQADGKAWRDWPASLRDKEPAAVAGFRREAGREVLYRQYLQWIASTQWEAARAASPGVQIIGDFPFGVAADSADVWAHQGAFSFEGTAGAPPDAFSEDGQNWALPVYRWDVLRADGYAWFGARARRMAAIVDAFRVDHVVGLFRSWIFPLDGTKPHFVPADEAVQRVQGRAILEVLQQAGATVIAEDLGTIPGFVRETLRDLGIPGYRVLRWERLWDAPGQPFIGPGEYPELSLATTGTHDTSTLADWWDELDVAGRAGVLDAIEPSAAPEGHLPAGSALDGPLTAELRERIIDAMCRSGSALVTFPIQDLFGWRDRINLPALVDDVNWTWKLPWPVDALAGQPDARECRTALRGWAALSGRTP